MLLTQINRTTLKYSSLLPTSECGIIFVKLAFCGLINKQKFTKIEFIQYRNYGNFWETLAWDIVKYRGKNN